jgi:transglutaminase-like putative cysteine protease
LRNTTLSAPTAFLDGNNDVIKMDYSSPQTNNILVDEENRKFEIKYENTQYTEGNFKIFGQIKNKCKGEWKVDLSDEMIERYIPNEDKKDKEKLAKIARNIIDEYDRNNEKNILSFMDFSKIGKWVYKNIKYDINYSGRTEMTAMDIYNQRIGVCHHMTRLANALLYSLGYQVIYASGYTCSESPRYDKGSGHCWSLIKVKGKWYPFDATWNILSGKLPVCHIFFNFFNKSISWLGTDNIDFASDNNKSIIEYYN